MGVLKSLSVNFNIWFILVLASVDCLFSFVLRLSWFLLWRVIFPLFSEISGHYVLRPDSSQFFFSFSKWSHFAVERKSWVGVDVQLTDTCCLVAEGYIGNSAPVPDLYHLFVSWEWELGWLKIRSLLSLHVTSKCKQTGNSSLCCYRVSSKGWLCWHQLSEGGEAQCHPVPPPPIWVIPGRCGGPLPHWPSPISGVAGRGVHASPSLQHLARSR